MVDKNTPLFEGRAIVIATMHEKERVMAPLLEKNLGVRVVLPKNFNSDEFGTFTRDIKRAGNQLETARKKVYAAMNAEGVDLGISSEGSFGAHPSIPFIQSNLELVLFVDRKNGYEIRGHHRTSETNMYGEYVSSIEQALDFAKKVNFPEFGLIVRKNENGRFGIYKDIHTKEGLIEKVGKLLSRPFTKQVFLETDMRAHKNPTRMKAIEKATEDLLNNISSLCPKCQTPGFVVVDFEKGLRCSLCNIPTELPVKDIYKCFICHHEEKKQVTKYGEKADPQHCGYCNP